MMLTRIMTIVKRWHSFTLYYYQMHFHICICICIIIFFVLLSHALAQASFCGSVSVWLTAIFSLFVIFTINIWLFELIVRTITHYHYQYVYQSITLFKSPACLTFNLLFSLLFVSVLSCLTQHPFPPLSTRPQCQDKRKRQSNIVRHSFDKNWTIVCTCCCLVWSCNLRCLPQPYKCWATIIPCWTLTECGHLLNRGSTQATYSGDANVNVRNSQKLPEMSLPQIHHFPLLSQGWGSTQMLMWALKEMDVVKIAGFLGIARS